MIIGNEMCLLTVTLDGLSEFKEIVELSSANVSDVTRESDERNTMLSSRVAAQTESHVEK